MIRLTPAGAAVLVALAVTVPASAQIGVSPLIIESTPGVVTISNDGARAARLALKLVDFEPRPDGSVTLMPFGTGPNTCGADVVVTPEPVRIAPQSQERVSLRIAPGARTCWSLLMVEASLDERPGNAVGVKAYRVAPGAVRSAVVHGVAGEERAVRLTVRNTGTAPLRPAGEVQLRTEAGAVVGTLPVAPFSVHPRGERWVRLEAPASVPAGRYVAVAVLDIGAPDLIAGQAVVDIAAARP